MITNAGQFPPVITKVSLVPGSRDTVIQPCTFNDVTDSVLGNQIISGSWAFGQGTGGALIIVRITAITGGLIVQNVAVQTFVDVNKIPFTVYNFTPNITAAGVYIFEIKPAASDAGLYTGKVQGAMPNVGQLLITMSSYTGGVVQGLVDIEHSW